MKKFNVKVTDKKTQQILDNEDLFAENKKYLQNIYSAKYRFHPNVVKIEIERVTKSPGVQIDLEDMIKEIEGE